jgi:hypothetical protein
MPLNNFVFLRGTVTQPPYFDRVPGEGEPAAFLRFYLAAARDRSQPNAFPSDTVRVVVYGRLAERSYPVLQQGMPVHVIGWLQYRVTGKGKSVLEVVAQELLVGLDAQPAAGWLDRFHRLLDEGERVQEIAPAPDVMDRLLKLAGRWGIEASQVLELLLTPQLEAAEQGLNQEAGDGD